MTTKKKVQKGGFPAKLHGLPAIVRKQFKKLKLPHLHNIDCYVGNGNLCPQKGNKKMKKTITQSDVFVKTRSATIQYLIDVLALAFILALLFTLINHIVK